jgi:hypothetical protein
VDDDCSLLDSVVTGDEPWCFQYDPETKRWSMKWCSPSFPRYEKFWFRKSKNKVMLVTFFDSQGIAHNLFHQVGWWIRNITWKYSLFWFKEFFEYDPSFRKEEAGSTCMTMQDLFQN